MINQNGPVEPLLSLRDIVMRFGSVQALRGADFDLLPGEVHGLLGQNGAGKSTLIKVIAGVYKPTSGTFTIDGVEQQYSSPRASRDAGISVVYQSLSLIPSLTVAQNLFLGIEPTTLGIVNTRALNSRASEFLELHKLPLRPEQLVSSLTFAYRQLCEIGKALVKDARILILDEPTSSLSKTEEPILFDAVREATAKGIGVIYVSHRLSEVFELTDRVTVFRDGNNAGVFNTADVTIPQLVEVIVGEKLAKSVSTGGTSLSVRPPIAADASVALELSNISNDVVKGVNLSIRRGEIVGLIGSIGSGRTELLESIFGVRKLKSGTIRCDGRDVVIRRPQDAIGRGIKLVPEDRHSFGLVVDHDIESNTAMAMLPLLRSFNFLFKSAESKAFATKIVTDLKVKAPSTSTKVNKLSGGNQQKIAIGKWLGSDTKVLLLDEPTAGVDVGARADIYKIIIDLADQGTAVLVCSSDYDELLQLCSRFAFISDGAIRASADRSQVHEEKDLHQILEASREELPHV
ncbi:ATP-binding protein of sugar ABC transporter [marine actinobacterium PHSC20C1]|nr:ATP-binding protein of sugar ABC transporter [marine actinobacterium PHSC20C1]